jgi:hypothetical protein
MEKIREVFAEETKNREKVKRTLRAKRRQVQAESLKQTVASKYFSFLKCIEHSINGFFLWFQMISRPCRPAVKLC